MNKTNKPKKLKSVKLVLGTSVNGTYFDLGAALTKGLAELDEREKREGKKK